MADSTTLGYLRPGLPPPYDAELEDIFHALCVGLTDLPGKFVRPRWQINPAGMPDQQSNWCAYGMSVQTADWDAFVEHDPNGNGGKGYSRVSRTEVIQVNFSFYGTNCQMLMSMFRDGMSVTQNRDTLEAQGVKFVEFMEPVTLPVLLKDTWNRRVDLKAVFKRRVTRVYDVNYVTSAQSFIDNEKYVTPLSVSNP